MKNKRIKYFILAIFIIIMIISILPRLLKSNIDDYYNYINKDEIDKIELKDDEVGVSRFTRYQDKVDKETNEIAKKIINSNGNVKLLNNLFIDKDRRNKNGIGVLKDYIDKIDNSSNINEFLSNVMIIEKDLNVNILSTVGISPDLKDNSKNIVYFMPISFDFGTNAYVYNDSNFDSYSALIKRAQIQILKLNGYSKEKARSISKDILDLKIKVANNSKGRDYLNNVENLYHVISKDELQNIYSNVNINEYLDVKKINNQKYYSIVDIDSYKAFNSILTNSNLNTLKEYVKIRVLEDYASYISMDYYEIINNFNNAMLGINKDYDLVNDSVDTIISLYGDLVDREYVLKNINDKEKEYVLKLINDIILYYKEDIKSISWMSEETKESAIKKLTNMKVNYANNTNVELSNRYIIKDTSLLSNIININKVVYDYGIEQLNKNDTKVSLGESVVNAYYNPQDNSINFPYAFTNFIDLNKSYYENLGSAGMVIAHEITHAFDKNGSKFDEKGNLKNWWKDSELKKFDELSKNIEKYYSNYKIEGINVNGELTLSENIADLGAVKAISAIARNKKATNDEMILMYKSFAGMWLSKYKDNYIKLLINSDTHSPDKVRVNATLSSCDEFYKTYDIKKSDKMYVSKNDRVGIW